MNSFQSPYRESPLAIFIFSTYDFSTMDFILISISTDKFKILLENFNGTPMEHCHMKIYQSPYRQDPSFQFFFSTNHFSIIGSIFILKPTRSQDYTGDFNCKSIGVLPRQELSIALSASPSWSFIFLILLLQNDSILMLRSTDKSRFNSTSFGLLPFFHLHIYFYIINSIFILRIKDSQDYVGDFSGIPIGVLYEELSIALLVNC
ncbi:unnamed protein product [Blepharisma stoltei]|uniref:Uncharacterized protein n=1 Tax=Blepharisma stoltei TaxID=1481888 RepID=A0AAU9KAN1_9CILI|nr:unnamed protein product [Blepharisma stoltei]